MDYRLLDNITDISKAFIAYGGGQRPLVRSRTAAVRSE